MSRIYDYINKKDTIFSLGLSCKDITPILNKDIIFISIYSFEEELIKNGSLRDDFYKYILFRKYDLNSKLREYFLRMIRVGEKGIKDIIDAWDMLYNSEDSFSFSAAVFELYNKHLLYSFLSIIFITDKDVCDIFSNCFKILESEKKYLDEDEYFICLKEEVFNAFKEVAL